MSTCSQYRAALSYNANLFLHLHPDGADLVGGLKADMVALQRQVGRLTSNHAVREGERSLCRHGSCKVGGPITTGQAR